MTQFDQRGQHITNQYNAGHDINFGTAETFIDLITELEKLKNEFAKASEAGILSEETATDAEYQMTKAIQQAKKLNPDKKTIFDRLNAAKSLIDGITAASEIVTFLVAATEAVQKFFS